MDQKAVLSLITEHLKQLGLDKEAKSVVARSKSLHNESNFKFASALEAHLANSLLHGGAGIVEQTHPISVDAEREEFTRIDPAVDAPDYKPRKEDKPPKVNPITDRICSLALTRRLFPACRNLRHNLRPADSEFYTHDPRLPTEEWENDDDIGFDTLPMDPADAAFISSIPFAQIILEAMNEGHESKDAISSHAQPVSKRAPPSSVAAAAALDEMEIISQDDEDLDDDVEDVGTPASGSSDDDMMKDADDADEDQEDEEEELDTDDRTNSLLDSDYESSSGGEAEACDAPVEPAELETALPSRPTRRNELGAIDLRVVYEVDRTGFEESREYQIVAGDRIAGRYEVIEYLGSAAFSRAVQCFDHVTKKHVCVKIIKNEKDYFDQSLDEIKVLQLLLDKDPDDDMRCVRMYDYFYYKENLFIVFELLRDNLYECQKYMTETNQPNYFTLPRLQSITRQILTALAYIHRLNLIHADLKPENVLIQSYSRCLVKVIDFGSSCFEWDELVCYVQSRSYRAPEVILGAPYDSKVDLWSLGAILFELLTGRVLFLNESVQTLLARILAIVGPIPRTMILGGTNGHHFFTRELFLFERSVDQFDNPQTNYLVPKRTSLRERLGIHDEMAVRFIERLLQVDPAKRPTALEALQDPWLTDRVYQ
ncbi:Protein kinase domain [Carpediemonas membranifera]|uniref:Protein kinase domain n=1 Tax=Carpediemonas membranifera TaxID=201153 RepID=A0A8J6B5L3_9EUKA|nr:Protein kinase domain [Carpediemonas membranifera]|eukprot:KAG9394759.1 Protein kinase domain [Carpediemonas membranifera]